MPASAPRLTRAQIVARVIVVVAGCCYATVGVLSRGYTDAGGDPMTLVMIRMVISLLVFSLWFALVSRRRIALPELALGTLIGLFQMGFTTCLIMGFDKAPVSLVVLLFYTFPLLVTLGAAVFFGERLSRRGLVLVAIGTAGLVLAIGTPAEVTPLGIAFGLGAGVGQALVVLGNRVLLSRGLNVVDISALTFTIPAAIAVALLAFSAVPTPPSSGTAWGYALAFAVVGSIIPFVLFYKAVAVIGASLTALLATVEPFVSVILAYLILDERLTGAQLAGGVLIVAAVIGLATAWAAGRPTPPVPEPSG